MFRASWILAAAVGLTGLAGAANANTITVTPADSVNYAVNFNGNFIVKSTTLGPNDANSHPSIGIAGSEWVIGVQTATGYADAGIVLGMDGSLTLGQLQSLSLNLAGTAHPTPTVNLWLDTGNDGKFFSFDGTGTLTGLNGDSYFGANAAGNIDESSSFGYLGGSAGSGTFTLSQLQSGADSGINANTKVALWVGITGSGSSNNYAFLKSVSVTTVPLPASVWSGMSLLAGLGIFAGVKRTRARLA